MFLSFANYESGKYPLLATAAVSRQNKFLAKPREIIGITNLVLRQNDKRVMFWKVEVDIILA